MATIDPTTNLGKLRLRCGDWQDLSWLPDSVYLQTLADNDNDIIKSAKICATYILGMLAFRTHRKMGLQLESWSGESFHQYKEYLILITKDPSFMDVSMLVGYSSMEFAPIIDFQNNWNSAFTGLTEGQQLARIADASPNDNSRTGWGGL